MRRREPHVTRTVHFFKLLHADEVLHLLPKALEAIAKLPWEEQGRYMPDATDQTFLSLMPHSLEFPLRMEFGRTRRDNLPDIERRGVKKTLNIAEDAGLIDVCHVVIFADGFVAAEFNRDGPRIGKLGEYLMFKGRLQTAPRFQKLYQRDVLALVRELRNVKFLELEIPPDAAEMVRDVDSNLYEALDAQRKVNETELIGLHFQARDPRDGVLKKLALGLGSIAVGDEASRDKFKTLKVRGLNERGKVRPVDILEDYLITSVDFPRASTKARSIKTQEAFGEIERAYFDKRALLPQAVVGRDPWSH